MIEHHATAVENVIPAGPIASATMATKALNVSNLVERVEMSLCAQVMEQTVILCLAESMGFVHAIMAGRVLLQPLILLQQTHGSRPMTAGQLPQIAQATAGTSAAIMEQFASLDSLEYASVMMDGMVTLALSTAVTNFALVEEPANMMPGVEHQLDVSVIQDGVGSHAMLTVAKDCALVMEPALAVMFAFAMRGGTELDAIPTPHLTG